MHPGSRIPSDPDDLPRLHERPPDSRRTPRVAARPRHIGSSDGSSHQRRSGSSKRSGRRDRPSSCNHAHSESATAAPQASPYISAESDSSTRDPSPPPSPSPPGPAPLSPPFSP